MCALRMISVGNISTIYEQYIKPFDQSKARILVSCGTVSIVAAGVISGCLRQQAVLFLASQFYEYVAIRDRLARPQPERKISY